MSHQDKIKASANIDWLEIQHKSQDTVVQIFTKVCRFNWLEPYKTPDQTLLFGSGFFINEHGYILTNYHVVEEAIAVQIQIPSFGKERFDVDILGVYPELDIALLSVSGEGKKRILDTYEKIPFLPLGDSDLVFRTQEILALGYPLGQQSLKSTQGIVSGRQKLHLLSYIQMTAPINPGNSGGPSINSNGEVIGINSAGILEAQNIGYIIPINDIRSAITDLQKVRLLRKVFLGAVFAKANDDLIEFLGNPGEGGYYIVSIFPNSPLAKAGVQEGDMIYKVNGYKVDRFGEISVSWSEDKISIFDLFNRYVVGDEITLIVYRQGKHLEILFDLKMGALLPIRFRYPGYELIEYEIIGGMCVMEFTLNHAVLLAEFDPTFVRFDKLENQSYGKLLVTNIFHDSPFDRARTLAAGDIITQINGLDVQTLDDFRRAVKKTKESGFLTVKTEKKLFTVISRDNILEQESELSSRNGYEMSSLIENIS